MHSREIIILATHSRNPTILTKLPPSNVHAVINKTADNSSLGAARRAALEEIASSVAKVSEERVTPALITIITDFNIGYSCNNVCLLQELINKIEVKGSYLFVRTENEIMQIEMKNEIKKKEEKRVIPFRLILVGGGGAVNQEFLDDNTIPKLDSEKALKQFNFENLSEKSFTYNMWCIAKNRTPRTPITPGRTLANASHPLSPVVRAQSGSIASTISSHLTSPSSLDFADLSVFLDRHRQRKNVLRRQLQLLL